MQLAATIFTFTYFKRSINLLKAEIQDLKNNAGIRLKVRFPNSSFTQELNYVLQQFPTREEMTNALQKRSHRNNFDTLKKRATEENLAVLKDVMQT